MRMLLLVLLLLPSLAVAHPFSKTAYSSRSAVRVGDGKLKAIVVVEVPAQVVLDRLTGLADGKKPNRKHVAALNEQIWGEIAAGLTVTVDGATPDGAWKPVPSKTNGKGAEGFFVYLVGYELTDAPTWGSPVVVELSNTGFADVELYLSGMAKADPGWTITENTAEATLGAGEFSVSDPNSWKQDDALRTLRVVYERAAVEPTPEPAPKP